MQLGTCLNPEPHEGEGSGWVKCSGNIWHKNGPSQCKPHPPVTLPEVPGAACQSDSDCSQLPNGKCWDESGFFFSNRQCVSECTTDGDCAEGETCFCNSNVNRCIPSNCRQDSDCGEGLFCKAAWRNCLYEVYTAICETAQDPCSNSSNCSNGEICYPDSSSWQCQGTGGCGRPLAVGEGYRVASLAHDGAWALRSTSANGKYRKWKEGREDGPSPPRPRPGRPGLAPAASPPRGACQASTLHGGCHGAKRESSGGLGGENAWAA